METVKTQDISTNDLNWKIEYDMDRCTMCGSCLATCTFQAIKADVIRIDKTTSYTDCIILEYHSPTLNAREHHQKRERLAALPLRIFGFDYFSSARAACAAASLAIGTRNGEQDT